MPDVNRVAMVMFAASCTAWACATLSSVPSYREPPPGSFMMIERASIGGATEGTLTGADVSRAFFESTGASPLLGQRGARPRHSAASGSTSGLASPW